MTASSAHHPSSTGRLSRVPGQSSLAAAQTSGLTTSRPTHSGSVSHLDIGVEGGMDPAGRQPDGQGGGVGECSRHHMAGCREGEHLEAIFLVELDELWGG